MRHLLILSLCGLALAGCGGSGSPSGTTRSLAGTYDGTWTNVNDPTDIGASSWTIDENGRITGSDNEVSQEFSYTVLGTVDKSGNVDATTSLVGGEEMIRLTGRLQFDAQGRLTGNLVWGSEPPSTYSYTFTRSTSP